MVVGLGTDFWGTAIYVAPQNMNMIDAEFINQRYKLLPLFFSLGGILTAFLVYNFQSKLLFRFKISMLGKKMYNFLNKKWFFDKVYNEQLGQFFFNFGYFTSYKVIDRGIFEILGPYGISIIFTRISILVSNLQTGYIYHYAFVFLIGITFLLGYCQLYFIIIDIFKLSFDIVPLIVLSFIILTTLSKIKHAK